MAKPARIEFDGSQGNRLAARLDQPPGVVRTYALFAHCFTCSKDIFAAARIAEALAAQGIAVLRFDFTGLGASEGEFANTNFSSNIEDLVAAADFLRASHQAPAILIGHSLGGAAVLAAAAQVPECKAVVTIGAPADAAHVVHNFHASLDDVERTGEAEVTLAGRKFTIRRQFLDDLADQSLHDRIARLKRALLVMHAPLDQTVGIDNAAAIFAAAKHPKSFVTLDSADHLLSRRQDAVYAANVIAAWVSRYTAPAEDVPDGASDDVSLGESGAGKFQQFVAVGPHRLIADEPVSAGGLGSGPSPYEFLGVALGACTAMTLRMYAEFKKLPLERVNVRVHYNGTHADDCADCLDGKTAKLAHFSREIELHGELDEAQRKRLLEIADRCPVHKTLEAGAAIATRLAGL